MKKQYIAPISIVLEYEIECVLGEISKYEVNTAVGQGTGTGAEGIGGGGTGTGGDMAKFGGFNANDIDLGIDDTSPF